MHGALKIEKTKADQIDLYPIQPFELCLIVQLALSSLNPYQRFS